MSTAANIVIADSTPANRTFTPVGPVTNGEFLYENRSTTTSAGFQTIHMSLSRASAARSTNRPKLRLTIPKEVTIDGVTTIQNVARWDVGGVLPDDMTGTERAHAWALLENLIATAAAEDLGKNLDAPR